jgi:hypothetical protein
VLEVKEALKKITENCLAVLMSLHYARRSHFRSNLTFFASRGLWIPQDYYWRKYAGTVSEDAIMGVKSLSHVYVGEAYVKNESLIRVIKYSYVSFVCNFENQKRTKSE